MGEISVRRLYIIKSEKAGCGCWQQYTRQDTGCFVDEGDIKFLEKPSKMITRPKRSPLENQDFYYPKLEEKVPEEADTIVWEDKIKERSRIIYSISYANLKVHPFIQHPAIREALERGRKDTFNLSHVIERAVKETIKDAKRTGRIKPKSERHYSDMSGDLD